MNKDSIPDFLNEAKYALPAIAFMYAFFLVIGFLFKGCTPPEQPTPRDKDGVDTIYTSDSVYIIHFKIDSVYEQEQTDHDDGN
jgi:hypothetical protein